MMLNLNLWGLRCHSDRDALNYVHKDTGVHRCIPGGYFVRMTKDDNSFLIKGHTTQEYLQGHFTLIDRMVNQTTESV